jgi:hypothetical protein
LAGTAAAVATAASVAASSIATSSSAAAPGLPTGRATLGFLVSTLSVELLVVRAEDEL